MASVVTRKARWAALILMVAAAAAAPTTCGRWRSQMGYCPAGTENVPRSARSACDPDSSTQNCESVCCRAAPFTCDAWVENGGSCDAHLWVKEGATCDGTVTDCTAKCCEARDGGAAQPPQTLQPAPNAAQQLNSPLQGLPPTMSCTQWFQHGFSCPAALSVPNPLTVDARCDTASGACQATCCRPRPYTCGLWAGDGGRCSASAVLRPNHFAIACERASCAAQCCLSATQRQEEARAADATPPRTISAAETPGVNATAKMENARQLSQLEGRAAERLLAALRQVSRRGFFVDLHGAASGGAEVMYWLPAAVVRSRDPFAVRVDLIRALTAERGIEATPEKIKACCRVCAERTEKACGDECAPIHAACAQQSGCACSFGGVLPP